MKKGFTAIEVILTIGTVALAAGLSVPMYRQYLIRNDLEIARQNVSQGIQRAKFLSQVAMNDSAWGFSTDAVPGRGVLFMGNSYATRNTSFDEMYTLPSTISTSGITEVTFQKITGVPSQGGIITLTALNGEQRQVSITIGEEGTVTIPEDWLTICLNPYGDSPETIRAPDSLWQYYNNQGATMGPCGSSSSSASSSSSSTASVNFIINNDVVNPDNDYTCTITVVGAELTDAGAYDMLITTRWKFGGGGGWEEPFGDISSPTAANINDDDQTFVYECGNYGSTLDVFAEVEAFVKKKYWYTGEEDSHWKRHTKVQTVSESDFVEVYKDGDAKPTHDSFDSPATTEDFLDPYVDFDADVMEIPENSALFIFELNSENLSQDPGDFQDLAVLLEISDT